MKQTAVELLMEQINEIYYLTEDAILIFNQAKAMEKEQIIDAYWQGDADSDNINVDAEQYYNEQYGK